MKIVATWQELFEARRALSAFASLRGDTLARYRVHTAVRALGKILQPAEDALALTEGERQWEAMRIQLVREHAVLDEHCDPSTFVSGGRTLVRLKDGTAFDAAERGLIEANADLHQQYLDGEQSRSEFLSRPHQG